MSLFCSEPNSLGFVRVILVKLAASDARVLSRTTVWFHTASKDFPLSRGSGAFDVSTRRSFPWGREARWGKRADFLVLMMPLFLMCFLLLTNTLCALKENFSFACVGICCHAANIFRAGSCISRSEKNFLAHPSLP